MASRPLMTMMAMAAVLGVNLPMGRAPREREQGPLTDSDRRDIEAAEAKRARKAAKRAAGTGSKSPGGSL